MNKEELKKVADGILYVDLSNKGYSTSIAEKKAYNKGVMDLADELGRLLN